MPSLESWASPISTASSRERFNASETLQSLLLCYRVGLIMPYDFGMGGKLVLSCFFSTHYNFFITNNQSFVFTLVSYILNLINLLCEVSEKLFDFFFLLKSLKWLILLI